MLIQLFVNGIIAASIYALVGLGFALIYNTTRFFHFAHGVVYAAGAYLAYTFSVLLGLPLIISIILAVGLTTLIGMLMEISIYRPLRRRGASSLILLIASLGIYIVLQNVISLIFGDDTKTIRSGAEFRGHNT